MKKILDLANVKESVNVLKDFIPEDPIFVCVGTGNVGFDSFGPIMGTILKGMGYKVYGTIEDPIHGMSIVDKLKEIRDDLGIEDLTSDDRIIGIDASITDDKDSLYKIRLVDRPLKPGAGIGRILPYVGTKVIAFPTIMSGENPICRLVPSINSEDMEVCESAARMLAIIIDGLNVEA